MNQDQPLDKRSSVALLYLGLPIFIFFLGWFELPIGLLMSAIVGIGIAYQIREILRRNTAPTAFYLPTLVALTSIAIVWTTLGGTGSFFYANSDWMIRFAVLRDLVVTEWPPSYGSDGAFSVIMRAPIAYYLPAAAIGKIGGIEWANTFLWLWTILGVAIFLSMLPISEGFRPKYFGLILILIMFSGMDIVGWIIGSASLPNIGQHIEWWTRAFQYSSNTTQLFWVPNHALPAWIAMALFYRHWKNPEFLGCAPLLFATLPLWSPFAAIGMIPFYLILSWRVASARQWQHLSLLNLAPAIGILALCGRYLTLDSSSVPIQVPLATKDSTSFLAVYFLFLSLEFLALAALLYRSPNKLLVTVCVLTLALLPLFHMGPGNDLVMRGGIAAQMLLCILVIDHFQRQPKPSLRNAGLIFVLMIGSVTPFQEFYRAISLPAWKLSPDVNLLQASRGVPAHYVARLNQPGLLWMMREPKLVPGPHIAPN